MSSRVGILALCCLVLGWLVGLGWLVPAGRAAERRQAGDRHNASAEATPAEQETGFLNRTVTVNGVAYRFQVYLPESYRRTGEEAEHRRWPVILFLHGRGERGNEGMWQTQVGLPAQLRDHPERWPFVVVMPQCPFRHFWTDPEMLQMALAALGQEEREFHTDADRTYLSGLSLGGYGAWELMRTEPHRWAAAAIASSGIFWSYAPERWQQAATLPGEYARTVGRLPVWLFHGSDDTTVVERQSELMYEALKANGGHVRLWVYQGLRHDSWTRAYNEPELPRWLLSHHLNAQGLPVHEVRQPEHEVRLPEHDSRAAASGERPQEQPVSAFYERLVVPLHPPEMRLTVAQMDALTGEYRDPASGYAEAVVRQGQTLYLRNQQGELREIDPESPFAFYYPQGGLARVVFDRDREGQVVALTLRDDRFDERLNRRR